MRQKYIKDCLKWILTIVYFLLNVFNCSLFAQTSVRWEMNSLTSIGGYSTTLFSTPVLIDTDLGKAMLFDGIDDGIIINNNPLNNATEFTVEVIFKPYSGGAFEQRFLHMEQDANNRILNEIRSNPGKTWYFDTFIKSGASSKTLIDSLLVHPSDKWYHTALVYKNNVMTSFVDGVQELTGSVTYAPVTYGQTSVGMRLNNVYFFKGAIKTVKVTNTALTPSSFIVQDAISLNNVPPTVSITSPANNTSFTAPASVTITATAADANGTVSKVDFYNGTTLIGTDASSPYSFAWTNVAASTYSITAKATDNIGTVTTSTSISITVNPPSNQAPTVSLTAPANNTTFIAPASITIVATAEDADGTVSKVDFYNGTTLLGTDASSPYSFAWATVSAGTYSITAKATDNSGAVTTSTAIIITVNPPPNQLPTVSITSPANNATFTAPASITITATAEDADGTISKVDFYNGTTLIGTDATSPYSFAWTNVTASTYNITAKATDNIGAENTSPSINITVNVNQPSDIVITSPADNSTVTANPIMINVTATDPDGSVTKLEYYDGTSLIGTSITQPYSHAWNNPSSGSHVITVKATDSNGGVTTSSPTTVITGTQTGIFSLSGKKVFNKVYPNPANTMIQIEAGMNIETASIRLLDALGSEAEVVITVSGENATADVSALRAGLYTLIIKNDDFIVRKKIVISR